MMTSGLLFSYIAFCALWFDCARFCFGFLMVGVWGETEDWFLLVCRLGCYDLCDLSGDCCCGVLV